MAADTVDENEEISIELMNTSLTTIVDSNSIIRRSRLVRSTKQSSDTSTKTNDKMKWKKKNETENKCP